MDIVLAGTRGHSLFSVMKIFIINWLRQKGPSVQLLLASGMAGSRCTSKVKTLPSAISHLHFTVFGPPFQAACLFVLTKNGPQQFEVKIVPV